MLDWFKQGNFSVLILLVNVIMLWQNRESEVISIFIPELWCGFIACIALEIALLAISVIVSKIRKK